MPYARYLLLTDLLPDSQTVFDNAWKLSPVGAICLVTAAVACLFSYLQWKELRDERKDHRSDCATKDTELKRVNDLFQSEMAAGRGVLQGVINKLETHSMLIEDANVKEELEDATRELKNGLRAIGDKMDIPAERMRMD